MNLSSGLKQVSVREFCFLYPLPGKASGKDERYFNSFSHLFFCAFDNTVKPQIRLFFILKNFFFVYFSYLGIDKKKGLRK